MSKLILNRDDVSPVAAWDAAQFAEWLLVEIAGSLEPSPLPYPFRPLQYLFLPSVPPWDTLAAIERALDSRARSNLRVGVGLAVDRLRADDDSYRTFEVLLRFAGLANCVEACDAIVRKVGYQGLGSPSQPKAPAAFALAVTTIAGMSPTSVSHRALQQLVSSPWLKPEYSPAMLVALARGDFDLGAHLDRLRGKLQELDGRSPRMKRMYEELLYVVPLRELAAQWARLFFSADAWFIQGLMGTRLEICQRENGSLGMRLGDVTEEMPISEADEVRELRAATELHAESVRRKAPDEFAELRA